jgi:hypothetical protein
MRTSAISSALVPRNSFVIRHSCLLVFVALMLIGQVWFSVMAEAQSPEMIGRWNVQIAFGDGNQRALRFEAQGEGKGSWELMDQRAKAWGMPASWPAKWAPGDGNSVTFSGNVEFPLGNVGRDTGTLVCKGKFETPDTITGEVEFAPLVGDRPTKHGRFKATRNHS